MAVPFIFSANTRIRASETNSNNTSIVNGSALTGFSNPVYWNNEVALRFKHTTGITSAEIFQNSDNHLVVRTPHGAMYLTKADATSAFRVQSVMSSVPYEAVLGADNNGAFVGSYTNHIFRIVTNNIERMRVDTSGHLTILDGLSIRFNNPANTVTNYVATNVTDDLELFATTGQGISFVTGGIFRWFMNDVGTFRPSVDATYDIGSSVHRVDDYFGTNSTINTSDIREKNVLEDYDIPGLDFVSDIHPIAFKWKSVKKINIEEIDGEIVETMAEKLEEEKRTHIGFSAQEIEEVLDTHDIDPQDFAALVIDEESGRYGLREGELLPILWKAVQELRVEVDALKEV